MTKELASRLTLGPILIALIVGALWTDSFLGKPWCMTALVGLGVGLGSREYLRMAQTVGIKVSPIPFIIVAIHLAILPAVLFCFRGEKVAYEIRPLFLCAAIAFACLRYMVKHGPQGAFSHLGAYAFGIIYMGLMPGFLLDLLEPKNGDMVRSIVLFALTIAACKVGDIFAFTGGKLFGRHKLIPKVSPGKTWEGFFFALGGAVGGTYLVLAITQSITGRDLPWPLHHWWSPIVWGLVLGAVGALGDLVESLLKRESKMKDSGSALGGFGGFLDVFDAILLAAPFAVILTRWL